MHQYRYFCCGYLTMDTRGEFDICPVCYWEDDAYLLNKDGEIISRYYEQNPPVEELLAIRSGANHGLTLKEARQNFRDFDACELAMKPHVRQPKLSEK